MATGLVGTIVNTANSKVVYTAASNAKVSVTYSGAGAVSVNGVPIASGTATGTTYFYVGRGQILTVSTGSSAASAIVSALEEAS